MSGIKYTLEDLRRLQDVAYSKQCPAHLKELTDVYMLNPDQKGFQASTESFAAARGIKTVKRREKEQPVRKEAGKGEKGRDGHKGNRERGGKGGAQVPPQTQGGNDVEFNQWIKEKGLTKGNQWNSGASGIPLPSAGGRGEGESQGGDRLVDAIFASADTLSKPTAQWSITADTHAQPKPQQQPAQQSGATGTRSKFMHLFHGKESGQGQQQPTLVKGGTEEDIMRSVVSQQQQQQQKTLVASSFEQQLIAQQQRKAQSQPPAPSSTPQPTGGHLHAANLEYSLLQQQRVPPAQQSPPPAQQSPPAQQGTFDAASLERQLLATHATKQETTQQQPAGQSQIPPLMPFGGSPKPVKQQQPVVLSSVFQQQPVTQAGGYASR